MRLSQGLFQMQQPQQAQLTRLSQEQRRQQIIELLRTLDEGLTIAPNIHLSLQALLEEIYKQKPELCTHLGFGTGIYSQEMVSAILSKQDTILRCRLDSDQNQDLFQEITARYLYRLLNSIKATRLEDQLPTEVQENTGDIIKSLKVQAWFEKLKQDQLDEIGQDQNLFKQKYLDFLRLCAIREDIKINETEFSKALIHREQQEAERANTHANIKAMAKNSEPSVAHIAEFTRLTTALRITAIYRESEWQGTQFDLLATLANSLEALFISLPQIQRLIIREHVYKTVKFTMSERVVRRFTTGLLRTRPSSQRRDCAYDTSFLNMIGEFMLVSMGVISKDVFTLRKFTISKELSEVVPHFHLKSVLDRAGLKSSGSVYFNRFDVMGRPPTADMDSKIRDFITRTLRVHKADILQESDFSQFVEDIKDWYAEQTPSQRKDKDTLREYFASHILKTINNEGFLTYLKDLLSRPKFHAQIIDLYKL